MVSCDAFTAALHITQSDNVTDPIGISRHFRNIEVISRTVPEIATEITILNLGADPHPAIKAKECRAHSIQHTSKQQILERQWKVKDVVPKILDIGPFIKSRDHDVFWSLPSEFTLAK